MTPSAVNRWLKSQRPLAGRALHLSIALSVANGLLAVVQAAVLAFVLHAVIFESAGLDETAPWLWALLAVFVPRSLCIWQAERAAQRAAARIRASLRDRLFRHLQRLGPAWLADNRSGALTETLTRGIDDLEGYYARFLPAMSLTMILPLAILFVAFPVDWLTALVMLVTAPLIPVSMIAIGTGAEARHRRQWKELTRMSAHFLDRIQGLTTLKLFGASARETAIVARVSDDYRVSTMRVLRIAFLSSAVLEFFAAMGIAVIAVLVGLRLYGLTLPSLPDWAALPEITLLQGLFVLMLAPEFYAPLRNLGTQYHARMAAAAAAERMIEILDAEPPGRAPDDGVDADARIRLPAGRAGSLGIRFAGVRFAYAEGREALRGLDLEIPAGSRVALVGTSGAGKTTVINLLLGFLAPTAGRILVQIEGREPPLDLAELDPDDWHRQLAWVPQQPRLFQGSVADNLRLGAPDADLAALRAAARRARADDFIQALPQGYDTLVGERGAGLSGGQIQRIALARAFLRDAPLAILDEATANLDPESERLVQAGIDELAAGRTLLVVAHRLATVRRADRILVLDQGQVVEAGDHAGLLARGGLYARMVAAYGGAAAA